MPILVFITRFHDELFFGFYSEAFPGGAVTDVVRLFWNLISCRGYNFYIKKTHVLLENPLLVA